jgi:hypothetical protein
MASIPTPDKRLAERADLPWLAHLLDADTRHHLAEEDRTALASVSAILLAVVIMGLTLGAVSVLFAIR